MFIVIDTFDDQWPNIMTSGDEGKPVIFDTREEAYEFGRENAQSFEVVEYH
jgi:hypothetical protein